MATYKEIKGTNIEAVASDPSNPIEGQVWYNTTDNVLKGQATTASGTWATGNNTNQARSAMPQATGTQTACIIYGGYGEPPPNNSYTGTESYNGTNWTEVNNLQNGRNSNAGCGTATAAITAGGDPFPSVGGKTETWNGTNWTEVNDLNTAREKIAGQGATYDDCMAAGGVLNAPNTAQAKTEIWNGTNWTEDGDLNTARSHSAGGGTTSAAVIANGSTDPGLSQATEEWTGAGAAQTRTFTDS